MKMQGPRGDEALQGLDGSERRVDTFDKPKDMLEAASTLREVERHLVLEWIPKEHLLLGVCLFDLKGTLSEYKSDWKLVSHAFDLQEDGSALLSCIFERESV
jgi:hypothetical protein